MSFEPLLVAFLKQSPDLSALVGTRIYPVVAAQNTARPYVVYYLVAVTTDYSHDGAAGTEYTIQFSVFADKYSDVCAVRDVLMALLSGYRGAFTSGSESINVVSLHDGTQHLYESATSLHHAAVDFAITIQQ